MTLSRPGRGTPSPSGPRRRGNHWLRVAILAAIVVVAGGGVGVWYLFFRPSGPPPVDLANVPLASPGAGSGARSGSSTPTGTAIAPTTAAPSAAASGGSGDAGSSSATLAGLDGTWKVDPSLGSGDTGSFVGYRAQEQLASIGANVAVGRTSSVTGTFALTGTTVTAASFSADLSMLKSDSTMRDGMISRAGLESSRFPTATFELTSPIDLGTLPADGTVIKATAAGKLTVHGVTKVEQIPLQAKRSATVIAIAGSLDVKFADFGMQAPTTSIALSVADPVTIEFQLLFARQ